MEAFILAIASFLLTLINIICIVLCALIVLRIKEVAPSGASAEQRQSDADRFFHDDMRRFRDYQKTIHTTQDLTEANRSNLSTSLHNSGGGMKRERRKQLLALASLHDLDLTNQSDLTLNNAEARDKVKQLYKTMVQFDKDAKRLDIGLQNKQTLPVKMATIDDELQLICSRPWWWTFCRRNGPNCFNIKRNRRSLRTNKTSIGIALHRVDRAIGMGQRITKRIIMPVLFTANRSIYLKVPANIAHIPTLPTLRSPNRSTFSTRKAKLNYAALDFVWRRRPFPWLTRTTKSSNVRVWTQMTSTFEM